MAENYLIGIDIGAVGVKAILIDSLGNKVCSTWSPHDFQIPKPFWIEQNPEDWWDGTLECLIKLLRISKVSPTQIVGIGLSGQMYGLVLITGSGGVLRPCILWNDQRSIHQAITITKDIGEENILRFTGNNLYANFTAPKIKWVQENEPELYSKVGKIMLPKDYIRYKLSGEIVSDVTDASGTALFNVEKRKWSREMLMNLNISPYLLPDTMESTAVSGYLNDETALKIGLPSGIPIIAGAGSSISRIIGAGALTNDVATISIDSAGLIIVPTDEYKAVPKGKIHCFCHSFPGKWALVGITLSAGESFHWFKENFGEKELLMEALSKTDAYELLTDSAEKIPPGSEGLLYLPYLTGERTPRNNPHAKGVFFGLSLKHKKAHFIRAIMEGICYSLRDSFDAFSLDKGIISEIRVTGGGAKSKLWGEILANVINRTITPIGSTEGAVYGAAILAGIGLKVFTAEDIKKNACFTSSKTVSPSGSVSLYQQYLKLFQTLRNQLNPSFDVLSSILLEDE
ncbi:MAG: xylulokinase [Caldisericia bacterium]|nr:xylulokinase [Caldisericia bacterium]